ncbi:MAG: hypothetical protein AAF629_00050 [Chloroflexota bacterium]
MTIIDTLTTKFYSTYYERNWPGDLSPSVRHLSIAEAYQVQDGVTAMRQNRGETVVGYKVGCTSQAIRTQFGLKEPISARLFSPYIYEDGVQLDWQDYVNCAIEPEMVLTIGGDLKAVDLSDEQLIAAIAYVSPGIELHNFKFWFTPPSSQELISSGGINAGLILGQQKIDPQTLSFQDEMFQVYKNGTLITQGPASEIMGGPLKSLRWLVNSLVQRGEYLQKGSLVIPGSPVELIPIDQAMILKIEIDGLGGVTANFKR